GAVRQRCDRRRGELRIEAGLSGRGDLGIQGHPAKGLRRFAGIFHRGGRRIAAAGRVQLPRHLQLPAPGSHSGALARLRKDRHPTAGITLAWRSTAAEKRTDAVDSTADRAVLSLDGVVAGWDYSAGLWTSTSEVHSAFTNGYVDRTQIVNAMNAGLLNPFGPQ